jgi:hypothetical protein
MFFQVRAERQAACTRVLARARTCGFSQRGVHEARTSTGGTYPGAAEALLGLHIHHWASDRPLRAAAACECAEVHVAEQGTDAGSRARCRQGTCAGSRMRATRRHRVPAMFSRCRRAPCRAQAHKSRPEHARPRRGPARGACRPWEFEHAQHVSLFLLRAVRDAHR